MKFQVNPSYGCTDNWYPKTLTQILWTDERTDENYIPLGILKNVCGGSNNMTVIPLLYSYMYSYGQILLSCRSRTRHMRVKLRISEEKIMLVCHPSA